MLNEQQKVWLTEIPEKELADLFDIVRKTRLQSLNRATPDYESGRLVQDEIAALHRLEMFFKSERNIARQEFTSSGQKQAK